MAVTTVRELAEQTKMPVERLLSQLSEAGVQVPDADSPISADEKKRWLEHLQGKPKKDAIGLGTRKITLKRKEQTELKVTPGRGARAKTINVEVRKKRTYVKRDEVEPIEEEVSAPVAEAPVEQAAPVEVPVAETVAETPAEVAVEAAAPVEAEQPPKADEPVAAEVPVEAEPEVAPAPEAKAEAPEDTKVESKAAADEAAEAKAPAEEAKAEPKSEEPAKPEKPSGSAEPEHLRTEISDLRRRVLENLKRAKEQEGDLERQREAKKKEEERLARNKARVARKGKGREELHVAKDKRGRRRKKGGRGSSSIKVDTAHGFERPTAPVVREVEVSDSQTVGDLAQAMAVKASELIKILMGMGVMATINQTLDADTAELVIEEMGHTVKHMGSQDREENLLQEVRTVDEAGLNVQPRPPVVTIMGHVDHGKTTLLDYIRKARVAAGEAGGITQHIGAYHVDTPNGTVTFLDTPGHAAFTSMRARGAAVTDVVILVVAADDGVMPQTEEAVQHARAAGVPLVVALTKSDKENADADKVKNELSKLDVIPEDWGGDTAFIPVSGITGMGVDDLLDAVLLQAEILELKAAVDGPAKAVVVESSLERGRGPVATVLVQSGTLHKGDVVLAGKHFGRVRALFDEHGKGITEVGPSYPVQLLGLDGTPDAGDDALVVTDERKARELVDVRSQKAREERARSMDRRRSDWTQQIGTEGARALPVLLKCDVQGSAEALADALRRLSTDEVEIKIVANGVGGISESDVDLATASEAMIIGFNTRADNVARRKAQEAGLELRYYSVIYDVINDVRDAASGLLGTKTTEQIVGVAYVRDVFRSSKFGAVAGCLVEEGTVRHNLPIRVLRDNVVIFEGELESLRRHKDDVQKVEAGTECGIAVKSYNDVRAGDRIEVFERVEVQRRLEDETTA